MANEAYTYEACPVLLVRLTSDRCRQRLSLIDRSPAPLSNPHGLFDGTFKRPVASFEGDERHISNIAAFSLVVHLLSLYIFAWLNLTGNQSSSLANSAPSER